MEVPLPEALEELTTELVHRGFAVERDEYSAESFGNRIVELEDAPIRVRIVRDRGVWSVSLSAAPGSQFASPLLWRTVLTGRLQTEDRLSLEDQSEYVLQDLDRIRGAIVSNHDETLAGLDAWANAGFERRHQQGT